MKKKTIALLLTLPLLLTGCGAPAAENALHSWDETVTRGPVNEDGWHYTLSAVHYPLHCTADDGRLLVEGGYDLPVMEVFRADGTPCGETPEYDGEALWAARQFNEFFARRMAAYQKDHDEICRLARLSYGQGETAWAAEDYVYRNTVEASFRSGERLICVTMTTRAFTGGAHGIQLRTAYCFDARTGAEVTINDMAEDYVGLRDAVAMEILQQIEGGRYVKYYQQMDLFEDYEEVIPEWMSRTLFFGEKDMKVIFGVYDIAPYSAGDVAFTIPYDIIGPYLNDYGRALLELDG